jgi:hypothetical protein
MKSFISSIAFVAASIFASSSASAGLTTWTDVKNVNTYVGMLGNTSYTHDLTVGSTLPFAFQPSGMTALSGSISIEIFDDQCVGRPLQCLGNTIQEAMSPEIVLFQIEAFDMDTGALQLGLNNFAAMLGLMGFSLLSLAFMQRRKNARA